MSNTFDEHIKKTLEGSSPESLGFRPDRDALWQQIEARKTSKTKVFPRWISHVAAVAAGLLIGFFFFYPGKNKQKEASVAVTRTAPIIRTIRDTVYKTLQPSVTAPPAIAQQTGAAIHHPAQPAAPAAGNPPQEQRQEILPTLPAPQEHAPEAPLVASSQRAAGPAVLHLADIENENARPRPEKPKVYALFKIIRIPANSEEQTGALSMSIGEQLSWSIKN